MKKHLSILLLTLVFLSGKSFPQQNDLQQHNGVEHNDVELKKEDSKARIKIRMALDINVGVIPTQIIETDIDRQAIAQLTHVLHHAIEGKHGHSIKEFLQALKNREQWMRMLNFPNIARRTVRAFNLESNKTHLKNHVKNLALLFPMSHFIEVMTAPAFMAVGTVHEFPAVVIGSGGSLLSLIAVPGLDPLCYLLFLTYPLKPVHKSIDFIRNITERSVRGIVTTIRLDTLLSRFHTQEDRFRFIKQELEANHKLGRLFNIELRTSTEEERLSLFDRTTGDKILSLKSSWDSKENRFYVQSISLSRSTSLKALKGFLHLLPWNARSAVREVLNLLTDPDKLESYKREFFVDRVKTSKANEIEVSFKDRAIYLSNKTRIRRISKSNQQSPCKNSFL